VQEKLAGCGLRAFIVPGVPRSSFSACPQSVEDVTIAELLEKDPEMRKEVEAEIAAHNWAP